MKIFVFRRPPYRSQVLWAAHFFFPRVLQGGGGGAQQQQSLRNWFARVTAAATAAFKSIMLAGRSTSHALVSSRTRTIILSLGGRPSRSVSNSVDLPEKLYHLLSVITTTRMCF